MIQNESKTTISNYPYFRGIIIAILFVISVQNIYSQQALILKDFRTDNNWLSSAYSGKYISTTGEFKRIKFTDDNIYRFAYSSAYPVSRKLSIGVSGNSSLDRFFNNHYIKLWLGDLDLFGFGMAVAGDLLIYNYSPGDAILESQNDPIACESQHKIKPSFSAAIFRNVSNELFFNLSGSNLLSPDMSIDNNLTYDYPISLSGGIGWRFKTITTYADFDYLLDSKGKFDFSAGFAGNFVDGKIPWLIYAGDNGFGFGTGYNFGEIFLGYKIEKALGTNSNISDLKQSIYVELSEIVEFTVEDENELLCPANPLKAHWLMISKRTTRELYSLKFACEEFDSVLLNLIGRDRIPMDFNRESGIWELELEEFPSMNSWITAYRDNKGFCLERIYNDGIALSRMIIPVNEYDILVPYIQDYSQVYELISKEASDENLFYLDSFNKNYWSFYLKNEFANPYNFAAPDYYPDTPQIELASEFAVEKIDNRLHVGVHVSQFGIRHRLYASSNWSSDCEIYSENKLDTLSFIIPIEIPDTIPIVVTGSGTDNWMRVYKIGPDTLDNVLIDKIWENTDYTLLNFVYTAEDNRHCRGIIDPELERLINKTSENEGKLLICGNNYMDALCAYNRAREFLPATQVRIDPSLIPPNIEFSDSFSVPDSIWFINNFNQAIIEWVEISQPEDVAGYLVFCNDEPMHKTKSYSEISSYRLNTEPVVGNMFIISDIKAGKSYYIRIAPISGDGKLGKLSKELEVRTKPRRKTTVYEFQSQLGNPSAFDFSEYREISMLYTNASMIDLYLGTNIPDEQEGDLMLKSPSRVSSRREIWQTRNAGIIFMDHKSLDSEYDIQEITSMSKKNQEKCISGTRYLVRTPDGYELVIRVQSVEGRYPNRKIDIQYIYRLIVDAPIYSIQEK